MHPKRSALMLVLAVLLMAGGFVLGRVTLPEAEVAVTEAVTTSPPITTTAQETTATVTDSHIITSQGAVYDLAWAREVFEGGDYFSPDTIEPVTHVMAWYLTQLGSVEVTLHCFWGRMMDDDFGRLNIYAIEIRAIGSNFYQCIDNLSTRMRFYGFYEDGFNRTFTLGDWNQDGHVDFSLLIQEGGTMQNTPSYFWLWDAEQNCFVENAELREASEVSTLMMARDGTPRVVSYWRGCPVLSVQVYYNYIDGHFIATEMHEHHWGDEIEDGYLLVTYRMIDGEWTVVPETRAPLGD